MNNEHERIVRDFAARDRDPALLERYRLTNPGQLFGIQGRERRLLALLTRHGLAGQLAGLRILDVGCGTGGLLLDFLRYGAPPANLAGIDLSPDRIALAQIRLPAADLRCGDAAALPYPDASFDLVCQVLVFSSLLVPATTSRAAAELRRVVRPGGLIVWYDLRRSSPGNPRVRAIDRAELTSLFPSCAIAAETVTLAAPLARWLAPRAWLLAALLEQAPLLRTHLLAAIQPIA